MPYERKNDLRRAGDSTAHSTIYSLSSEVLDQRAKAGILAFLTWHKTIRSGLQLRDSAGLSPDFPRCPGRDTFAA